MPAEVKVLGWRKGERSGMVVRGAGGPGNKVGGGTIRVGGHVPWGAKVVIILPQSAVAAAGICRSARVAADPASQAIGIAHRDTPWVIDDHA